MSEEVCTSCRYCARHGLHNDWRYQASKRFYHCRKCLREDRRADRIKKNYAMIKESAGEVAANRYLAECRITGWVYPARFMKKKSRLDGVLD